jgi:iron complex outermembrane receptor protein
VQDYVAVTPWLNLLVGARYSEYKEFQPAVPDQKGDSLDPTVGVIVKPREHLSLYASLTRSSTPNVGTLTGPGQYADPSEAEQYEIGAKGEWFDRALRTSLAVYEITKTNVPTAIAGSIYSELSGEVRARGWELEVVGQLTPAWSVSASWADTDAEITEDNNAAVVGNTLGNTPEHTGSLWTTYAFDGIAQGWTVGGGAFYTDSKFVANNNLVALPSHTIVDAMASYQFDARLHGARLQVNLRNVFDERAYDTGSSNNSGFINVFPVLPRTLSLSLTVPLL